MKAYNILKMSILLLFLLPVFLIVTCNKDDNENSASKYRIVKANFSFEDIGNLGTEYEYQGDKIVVQHHYQDNQEIARTQIDYPDNITIESVTLVDRDSSWTEYDKQVYKLEGNHVIELKYFYNYGSAWEEIGKETFRYENDNMVEFYSYSLDHESYMPDYKVVYKYQGKLLILVERIGYFLEEWQKSQKDTITYTGNQIDSIFMYEHEDGTYIQRAKVGFTYEGDLIKTYTGYSNEDGPWEEIGITSYAYDSYGNLTSIISEDGNDRYTAEYIYEQGAGNYKQLTNLYGWPLSNIVLPRPSKTTPNGKDFLLKGLHPDLVNSHFLK